LKTHFIIVLLILRLNVFSQDTGYAREIVNTLASQEFKGRGYVEKGDSLAADFIMNEFRRIGLKPVFSDSYYQEFNISVNTFPGKLSLKFNHENLIPGRDFLVESSSPSISGKFPLIKVSRTDLQSGNGGKQISKKSFDSFLYIDSRPNKSETPEISREIDKNIRSLQANITSKIKGIIISTNEKLNWDVSINEGKIPAMMLSKDTDLKSYDSVQVVIESKFISDYTTRNVAGKIEGTSGSDSVVMVVAHYDHLGEMGTGTFFPGANDNASGVAMILNLARYFTVNKPKYTTVFVSLGAEEAGLLGARAFTENPPIDLNRIKFLINFDLAGTGNEGIKVVNGTIYKDKFELLSELNKKNSLLPKVEIRGPACNSDHCLFYRKGVPCFYIYTLGGISVYHDIYDRPETLPLTEFNDYMKLMIEFLRKI
jgi:hypothetical protein